MKATIEGTTNGIDNLQDALKFCQNFARYCYSEKNAEEIKDEPYKKKLTEDVLIGKGHHSPFEQFEINFFFEDVPKALAMLLNNQKFYATTEKSARYTFIPDALPEEQREKYMKWYEWFKERIPKHYPEEKFPGLYKKGSDGKMAVEKLSQENARYMGTVFFPTRMGHKLNLSNLNKMVVILNDFYEKNRNAEDQFKRRLAGSVKEFVDLPEVQKFVYENGFPQKGGLELNLFGEENEEYYGKTVYSSNAKASFAGIAQRHRHRTITHHFIDGYQLGAKFGFFVPPLVEAEGAQEEWNEDLKEVSKNDIPNGQIVYFGLSGNTRELPMMTTERICNNAQLETNMGIRRLLETYSQHRPEMEELLKPDCYKEGCPRGGCSLGPDEYEGRLV